jgi:D-alanyl-D-alanine carboxypeptidase
MSPESAPKCGGFTDRAADPVKATVPRRDWLCQVAAAGVAAVLAWPPVRLEAGRMGTGGSNFRDAASNSDAASRSSGQGRAAGHLSRRTNVHDDVARKLDGILARLAARGDVHGVTMAVRCGDGTFAWSGASGCADGAGTPMHVDTPVFLASITKLYLAVAVLRLYENGRFALDQTIGGLLPSRLIAGLHRIDGQDHTGAITVKHLLSHTSGLADVFEDRPQGRRSLIEELLDDGDFAWTREELFDRARGGLRPHFPPQPLHGGRARIRYSDTNYQLLIAIIEETTGAPLSKAVESLLFEPLGLERTWLPGHARSGTPAMKPAGLWFGDRPLHLPRALASFGDLMATIDDALRFLGALTQGRAFRRPATRTLMTERWRRFPLPFSRAALRLPGWPIQYGLGVMRFDLPRIVAPLRPAPAIYGHSGSTGSWLFHCPELDLSVAGSVNQATAGALPFRFLPDLLRAASPLGA